MAFKEYDKSPTFLDMEIQRAVTHSRNQQVLSEIDAVINWESIEKIVQENYPVGQSEFGNKAYPPLMLRDLCTTSDSFQLYSPNNFRVKKQLCKALDLKCAVVQSSRFKIQLRPLNYIE